MSDQKIRMGMVGGGPGAFIGEVHRMAARLDGRIELVCGAFSSDPDKSLQQGKVLGIESSRCYADFEQMMDKELQLPEDQRMQFVSIVTPNHMHYPVAKLALEKGFHVLSDKPATLSLAEALSLKQIIEQTGCLYGLTHTYQGYPLVREAKARIENGELGTIRKVVVEYQQGWLASEDDEGSKQAAWRLDPSKSGISNCMGDIGVHAANLAEFVSGQKISSVCADLDSVVPNRSLDDDGNVLLRFENGARGVLFASQIAVGEENNLRLRVYGDKASIDWSQQSPNDLWVKTNSGAQLVRTGVGDLYPVTTAATRTPSGHPEGYIEAFANLYCLFADALSDASSDHAYPNINDAVRGMAFIELVVAASNSDQKWCPFVIQE